MQFACVVCAAGFGAERGLRGRSASTRGGGTEDTEVFFQVWGRQIVTGTDLAGLLSPRDSYIMGHVQGSWCSAGGGRAGGGRPRLPPRPRLAMCGD